MKVIQPSVQILSNINGDEILKHLEMCGRVCYKSEDKISEVSSEKFLQGIIKRGHEAVLEHASFIFNVSYNVYKDIIDKVITVESYYFEKMYLRFTDFDGYIVSGNVRAWRDFFRFVGVPIYMKDFIEANSILFPEFKNYSKSSFNVDEWSIKQISVNDLVSNCQRLVHEDVSVRFVCDRGISHEIVRHRDASYCQESTRYCNYTKEKFGNEITVIQPCFFEKGSREYFIWERNMERCEKAYFDLLDCGCTPQQARDVLPNSLKTEIVMTANIREWRHFLKLRCSQAAHPQMVEVACKVLTEFHLKIPVLFDDIWEEVYG